MEPWTSFLIGILQFPLVHHLRCHLIHPWVTPDVIPWLRDLYWHLMANMIKSKFIAWVLKASINLALIYLSNLNLDVYLKTLCFCQTEPLLICLSSFYLQLCSHSLYQESFPPKPTCPNYAHWSLKFHHSWSFLGSLQETISFHSVLVLPFSWPSQRPTCAYQLRYMCISPCVPWLQTPQVIRL